MKRGIKKLTVSLMSLSVLPLLVFGVVVVLITSGVIYASLRDEVEYSMNILAHSSYNSFEMLHPGDYQVKDNQLMKGDAQIEGKYGLVDEVKQMSGADITLFYGDVRYLTTLRNEDGTRPVGTRAEKAVTEAVLQKGGDYFSDRVLVNNVQYFGYYMPLRDKDGVVTGMLFAGKPRAEVMKEIGRNILLVSLSALGIMAAAMAAAVFYGRKIIDSLSRTKQFLGKVAQGDLAAEIDSSVSARRDEIGEMARFAGLLRDSIASQIGRDPLTSLPNRRSCDAVLETLSEEHRRKGALFTVAMGDIDCFKRINDTYGHQAGDRVLKEVAGLLAAHMEHLGFVFRWGGEEFLLVYENMSRREAFFPLQQLQREIGALRVPWEDKEINITITFGLADSTEEESVEDILQLADAYLYSGKSKGRDRIILNGEAACGGFAKPEETKLPQRKK